MGRSRGYINMFMVCGFRARDSRLNKLRKQRRERQQQRHDHSININSNSSSVAIYHGSRGEGFLCCRSTPAWGSALGFRVGARAMLMLRLNWCNAEVNLDELGTDAALRNARDMLQKCRSRSCNIKSGKSSNCNPGEVDDLQTRVIPLLAAAIQDAAPSVGFLRISKMQQTNHQHRRIANTLRKLADKLESWAKKGSLFAENVEVCLGDFDAAQARGASDERACASAPPGDDRAGGRDAVDHYGEVVLTPRDDGDDVPLSSGGVDEEDMVPDCFHPELPLAARGMKRKALQDERRGYAETTTHVVDNVKTISRIPEHPFMTRLRSRILVSERVWREASGAGLARGRGLSMGIVDGAGKTQTRQRQQQRQLRRQHQHQ